MNCDSIARIEFIRPSMGARSDLDLYSTSLRINKQYIVTAGELDFGVFGMEMKV